MMKIWIVTIGSSDVQLNSKTECRQKQKDESETVWRYWYEDKVKAKCCDIDFELRRIYKDVEEPYRIEHRVLGLVYHSSSDETKNEIWSYLTFPLLDRFVDDLKNNSTDGFGDANSAITVLLTDQSQIFQCDDQRDEEQCPYWQDTCQLEPILRRYFKDRFPNVKSEFIEFIKLAPNSSEKGLDNWDSVLDLVDKKLSNLKINKEAIAAKSVETVYVSHQASTPAISSAVQFSSLARFEEKVQFLVSNEYDKQTDLVSSSKYLNKIQRGKAKKLLNRHDYAGVKELLKPDPKSDLGILLDAAIQWNFADFKEFKEKLYGYSDKEFVKEVKERTKKENWWWTAYEAAYLGVVRLKQGNTVEALFHSFRSVEGLIVEWAKSNYSQYVKYEKDKYDKNALFVSKEIQKILPGYRNNKFPKQGKIKLFSQSLYDLLQEDKGNCQQHSDMKIFLNDARDERNKLFHQLVGLQKEEIFAAWDTNEQEWKDRVLGCLNFIAEPKPPFSSLEEASLMFQVHQKLEKAIAE
ncbi:MAG: hypothetical protein SW833_16740 [Cyanobacteriota bacterium]|nr:hypothetical protein [Cyanobacteriota bacterium]